MKFYKYPNINTASAFIVGLLLVAITLQFFTGHAIAPEGIVAASVLGFAMPYRSPDPGGGGGEWNAETVFKTADEAVAGLKKFGHSIRTAEEDKTYLQNATKTAVDTAIKDHTKTMLDGWDKDIATASGVKREDGVKTSDYIKDVVTNFKKKFDNLTGEYDTLKEKQLSKDDSVLELQNQLKTAKDGFKTQLAERDGQITEMKASQFQNSISTLVSDAMSKIRPILAPILNQEGNADANMLEMLVDQTISKAMDSMLPKEHEGNIIFHNKADDTAVLDSEGNHMSMSSILAKAFEPLIDKQHKAAGTGGEFRKPGEGNTDDFKLQLPADVNNRVKLHDHILKTPYKGQKLDQLNPEHNAIIDKMLEINGKDLPLR